MKRVLVVGGGVAALATALELVERGLGVDLLGPIEPARRPELAEGGINLGLDADALYRDTIACAAGLAAPAAVRSMARAAQQLVEWLRSAGVPFASESDGALTLRTLQQSAEAESDPGGAVFIESRTAQHIAWMLDEKLSAVANTDGEEPALRRFEPYALVELVTSASGRVRGCIAQHLVTMDMRHFDADAVVLAGSGPQQLAGGGTTLGTETALAAAARAGALLADLDLMQRHPAALLRGDQRVFLSSSLLAEGARFWVPSDAREVRRPGDIPKSERDYFLEERFEHAGNRVGDDLAARTVHEVAVVEGRGLYDRSKRSNGALVFLDLSHLPKGHLEPRVGSELDAVAVLTADDPYDAPVAVTASCSGTLGGLWVDHQVTDDGGMKDPSPRNHATSVEGLYAVGDLACLYHGACRLRGNRLLADLFGGGAAARALVSLLQGADDDEEDQDDADELAELALARYQEHREAAGDESPHELGRELAVLLSEQLAFDHELAEEVLEQIAELGDRLEAATGDRSEHANRGATSVRAMHDALLIAEAVARSSLARNAAAAAAPRRILCRLDEDHGVEVLEPDFDPTSQETG